MELYYDLLVISFLIFLITVVFGFATKHHPSISRYDHASLWILSVIPIVFILFLIKPVTFSDLGICILISIVVTQAAQSFSFRLLTLYYHDKKRKGSLFVIILFLMVYANFVAGAFMFRDLIPLIGISIYSFSLGIVRLVIFKDFSYWESIDKARGTG